LVNRLFFLHSSSQTKTKVQHGPLTRVNRLAFRLSLSSLAHMQLSKTDSKSRLVWWSLGYIQFRGPGCPGQGARALLAFGSAAPMPPETPAAPAGLCRPFVAALAREIYSVAALLRKWS
jgi:hypothetical protein